MKTKGLIYIFTILVVFLLQSCDYFFQSEENFFSGITTTQELEDAVDGVEDYFLFYLNKDLFQNSDIFGDDQVTNCLQITAFNSYDWYYSKTTRGAKGYEGFLMPIYDWNYLYRLIASANAILVQFDIPSVKDENTRNMLGEMFFYRAYLHYRLMLLYGRIPIIDNDEVNFTTPRSSFQEIYEFVEIDLKQAIQLLPANKTVARIPNESPDRGCAKAMLGEVYLSWAGYPVEDQSKYRLAAEVTGEIIDSAAYFNYELLPDYEDVWSKRYQYTNEAIFCRYIKERNYYSSRYNARYISTDDYYDGGFGFDGKLRLQINDVMVPEINFYNTYPKSYRKDITFFTRVFVDSMCLKTKHGQPRTGIEYGYFDVERADVTSRAAYRKFFIDTTIMPGNEPQLLYGTPKLYLIRFAQTLLTYAEASARSGNLNDKAYECVNMVRRRANHLTLDSPSPFDLPPGLSPEAFADSIVQERAWELAGEIGHRWFDMVRTQTVEKVFEQRDPNDGGPFKPSENDKYFFTIPEGDINLNPNLGE